jgi:hypothetical protein
MYGGGGSPFSGYAFILSKFKTSWQTFYTSK